MLLCFPGSLAKWAVVFCNLKAKNEPDFSIKVEVSVDCVCSQATLHCAQWSVGDSLPPAVSSLAPVPVVRTPGNAGRANLAGQDSATGWQ